MHDKTYTVGYMMGKEDAPIYRISGKWLKELRSFYINADAKSVLKERIILIIRKDEIKWIIITTVS